MSITIDSFDNEFGFLSNFYSCKVEYNGVIYPSSEHAYQAQKTNDYLTQMEISLLPTPGQAKRAGKRVKCREDWEEVKVGIMHEIVLGKFKQNPELLEWLLATGGSVLVEGNTWNDTFWGRCKGVGENKLGLILMAVRIELGGS
jgi:ribA/ribD-fused uncharacterized protein